MKPTLFILAAGMGSRYGGLKQLDGLGPNGETIMDYSVFDALRAGFGKIVFVIRKDFEADFREKVLSKYADKIQCEVCFQAIDLVVIGCVIQGDTPHFDYVCQSVTQGVATLNAQGKVPIIFSVLTVLNKQQALDRCGGKLGNKGIEGAYTAIRMANL